MRMSLLRWRIVIQRNFKTMRSNKKWLTKLKMPLSFSKSLRKLRTLLQTVFKIAMPMAGVFSIRQGAVS